MSATSFFLRNRRFSLLTFLFLVVLGLLALRSIPLSEDPSLEIPRYDVIAVLPGSSPVDMETLVVRPLEKALHSMDNVKRITAAIRDSVAQLSIEFRFGADTDKKYDEVLRQVNELRPKLPQTLAQLKVMRGETANVAIMQLALVSENTSYKDLSTLAERLCVQLEGIRGVRKAQIHACPEQELRLTLNTEEIAAFKISAQQIVSAMSGAGGVVPGGALEQDDRRLNVKTSGAVSTVEKLRELPITTRSGEKTDVLRLKDFAEVSLADKPQSAYGRYNGERAIFLAVTMQEGQNIFLVSESIRTEMKHFRSELAPGTRLELGFDQSTNVHRRMVRLQHDFAIALLLILITLSPLGLRSSLIVMISIPLCLAMALAALHAAGFSLNQLSIVGCVIALGLLVDDSIVVVENIARFRRAGLDPVEAAGKATRQIASAVTGTTATLIFAFVPLLLLPEAAGLFIRSLPAAVVLAVLASWFVSLTIVPWLAGMFFAGKATAKDNFMLMGLQRVITVVYTPLLRWCMRHRGLALGAVAALCSLSLALIPRIGLSLFPKADIPLFLIQITAAEGSSLKATDKVARRVEDFLRSRQEIKHTFTTIGEGNPRVYYNVFPPAPQANLATILVALEAYDGVRTPAMIQELRAQVERIDGAEIEIKEFQNGPPVTAPIEVRLLGENLAELAELARKVETTIQQTPGSADVINPVGVLRTDMLVNLDEDKLALEGISVTTAAQGVRLAFAGLNVGKWRGTDGREVDVRLCLLADDVESLGSWKDAAAPNAQGKYVRLSQLSEVEMVHSPALIERRDRERVVTLSAHAKPGFYTESVTDAIRERLKTVTVPNGYRIQFGGETESREESFAGFGAALVVAVFGILAVLVLEFKTFRGTLIVASVIPLGIIGGLVGLWLAGYTLSFMAMLGFIALIGIEIKNSILLVDFTNQLREEGVPLDDAIAKAGELRFLPVVLTTFTALGALLPLVLQRSALYSSLAVVIMGGSLSSLILSRLVTPILYRIFPPKIQTTQSEVIA